MVDRIRCASIVLIALSIAFCISGSLLITFSDSLINSAVSKECQLRQGTLVYNNWRQPPVPLYIEIYVFDLVNVDEFLNGAKPRVIERGPFVYKEERIKEDVKSYSNGTISYREARKYIFDPLKSIANETFSFTTINIVYMTIINYLQTAKVSDTIRNIIGTLILPLEKPVMQRTVKEYLWGYQDEMLGAVKKLLPHLIKNDQISVLASVVDEAQYETILINSGVGYDDNNTERIHNVGKIERFNFSSSLSIWSNKYANMINGTDSTLWHPDVSKNETIYTFMSDICRSVYLKFDQTRENPFGITTYRFIVPNETFANSSNNEGFCVDETSKDNEYHFKCLPYGLFSLSPCLQLSSPVKIPLPIIASNPHFLATDQAVREAIDGLNPNELKHRSFMDIEPLTGIIMNGTRRMQFNIKVLNDSHISAISHIRSSVYPMIWVNEHAAIDKPNADLFHKKVVVPLAVLDAMKYVVLGIGISLFVLFIGLFIYGRHFSSQQENASALTVPVEAPDETTPLIT